MNSLDTRVVQYQNQPVGNGMADWLLVLLIGGGIIFYINNKLSKIAQVSERYEARAQIINKQVNNVSELCERLIIQNIGSYDRSTELARDMVTKFENMNEQIATIPATIDKIISADASSIKKSIEEIHSVRALDNVEGLYQCWSGTGVYFKEGHFKFTTEIRITNKHLKTCRENQIWLDATLENDTSIPYRDMLMESISKVNPQIGCNGFNIPPDFVKKTYHLIDGQARPYTTRMSCVKYDWNGSIEIDITAKEVYCHNGQHGDAGTLMKAVVSSATIDWKKSLVPQQ